MEKKDRKLAKRELNSLLNEFCTLTTAEEERIFAEKMNVVISSKNEDELQLFSQVFVEGAKEAIQQSEELVEEVNLRLTLENIFPAISWSYIASHYFNKSRAWLHQRISGNLVNGNPAKFTQEERRIFINALNDLGANLRKTAQLIEQT